MPVPDAPPSRVVVSAVQPSTPDRISAAKGTAGLPLRLAATVFADGHDAVAARARWRAAGGPWETVAMTAEGNDLYTAAVVPAGLGAHELMIDGWIDAHGSWRHRITAKLAAGQDVTQELEEGARLLEGERDRIAPDRRAALRSAVKALRNPSLEADVAAAGALDVGLADAVSALPHRVHTTASGPWPVWVERMRAAVGAWYELFPRSYGGLAGAAERLGYVAGLGFDVVYLPPIHPIGTTARKGPGNALAAGRGDPGSPWAIGSADGGHDAVAPELGTIDDFDAFVTSARALGLEVALDYALQCSPDHPWVSAHPEWFSHRPDGSIRYAENPPKQYQDIFPLDFYPADEHDRIALWEACREVMAHWIAHGVRIFRVDNPHTKPFAFWMWLIDWLRRSHPDVVLLAEAFTRPAAMHRLAEIGFSQSYTYFTWRTSKDEITAYGTELAQGPDASYFRPNFWPNTPDILSGVLRNGPRAAFEQRAVLAATLSPSWGVYSGYELCENVPASDSNEEYAASEKYEIKQRHWDSAQSISGLLARLNDIRRRHPALADLGSLRFHHTTSPVQVAYSKQVRCGASAGIDTVLVVVSLDPWAVSDGTLWIDLGALGLPWNEPLDAYDELSRQVFPWWGPETYVRLGPDQAAHIIHLRRASEVPFSGAPRP